jgi:hypothetical protein
MLHQEAELRCVMRMVFCVCMQEGEGGEVREGA